MSRRAKLLLGTLGVVVLAVVVWFLVLQPLRSDVASTNQEIENMRARLQAAQAKLAQAEVKREEAKYNQARLLELAKMVPESEETPSLIVELEDLARQSGVELRSISRGETAELATIPASYVPIDLELYGKYFDVSDFVYRLEQMVARPGRLLAVKTVALEVQSGQEELALETSPTLRATLTVYAFVSGKAVQTGGSTGSAPTGTTPETTTTGP
ncbi:MAG: type 4a pilus biogenesis protein PilO [Thermoleophilia bacterium]|nr:type 4a pilus biogenesis protein PilO [Thermoleophilia bacterium]